MPAKIIIETIKKGGVLGGVFLKLARVLMEHTASSRLKLFENYLNGHKVLDVGLGSGAMAKTLSRKGYSVTGMDVVNTSLYPEIVPVIYGGVKMPNDSRIYDVGLLICVLHHCPDQIRVLEETMRVCKRVIIIEDTFRNSIEKMLVSARDCVGNFEFFRHEYRTTKDWKNIFSDRKWKVIYTKEWSSVEFYGMYGRQTLFVIEKRG